MKLQSIEEFVNEHRNSRTNGIYSPAGVLGASSKINAIARKYLQEHPMTQEELNTHKFSGLIRAINLGLPVGNTVHNISKKYGSFETYLSYLVRNLHGIK